MTATRKITEAESVLTRLQGFSDKQFQSEFDILVKTIHEIFGHLLEEYNVKFDCKVERVSLEKFKAKARKMGKIKAINFLIWYEKEYKKIRNNPDFGYLLERNNIDNHDNIDHVNAVNACSMLLDDAKKMAYYAYENF